MQPQQHVMHIDFESLRYVQLISIDAQVLVIVAGSLKNMQPQQHAMHIVFESLRGCVQLISIDAYILLAGHIQQRCCYRAYTLKAAHIHHYSAGERHLWYVQAMLDISSALTSALCASPSYADDISAATSGPDNVAISHIHIQSIIGYTILS